MIVASLPSRSTVPSVTTSVEPPMSPVSTVPVLSALTDDRGRRSAADADLLLTTRPAVAAAAAAIAPLPSSDRRLDGGFASLGHVDVRDCLRLLTLWSSTVLAGVHPLRPRP